MDCSQETREASLGPGTWSASTLPFPSWARGALLHLVASSVTGGSLCVRHQDMLVAGCVGPSWASRSVPAGKVVEGGRVPASAAASAFGIGADLGGAPDFTCPL